jgi:hypothetical protein
MGLSSQVPVAHAYNASYLGDFDQEDYRWRLAKENSSHDPISKITRAKWTGGVAQEVEHCFASVNP